MASTFPENDVKLKPTDFLILNALREGRNTPSNLAAQIDRSKVYVNERIGQLLDYGLVEKIGPLENSGLYELTVKGEIVADHEKQYGDDDVSDDEFDELIEERLQYRRDD